MTNFDEIMRMAQDMQKQLADAQNKMDSMEVEGSSGSGMVKIRATAKGRVVKVTIDPSLIVPEEKEILEDLITAAYNDARAKADALSGEEMKKLGAGFPMPPGFNLPG